MCSSSNMRCPRTKPNRMRYSQIGARTTHRVFSRRLKTAAASELAMLLLFVRPVDDRAGDGVAEQVEAQIGRRGRLRQVQLLDVDGVHHDEVAVRAVTGRRRGADEP